MERLIDESTRSIKLVTGDLVAFENDKEYECYCMCGPHFKCVAHIGDNPLIFIKEHSMPSTGSIPISVNVFYDKNRIIYTSKGLSFKLLSLFTSCVDV